MNGPWRRAAACAVAIGVAVGVSAGARAAQSPLSIRLATLAPEKSIWDTYLKQMGDEWKQGTSGRVSLTIYNGGAQGDDASVLRKIKLGALQAASLSPVGLSAIDWSFTVVNIPFFFDSYDELNAVLDKLTPALKQRMDAKGFVLLNWGYVGWLQIFSKRPVQTVADLKGIPLYTSAGDDKMTQVYKANGYQPRALAMTDVMTGLTTGMIEALPVSPSVALQFQWFRQTPYMLEIGLSPLVGGTIVDKRVWSRLSEADRARMSEAAVVVEQKLRTEVPKQDALAVAAMSKLGNLKVTKAAGPEWEQQVEILAKSIRGQMVPADIYDLALKERTAFRQRKSPPTAK
jgi:TRAP-type C4-dicarboxylate transport system substrate-binding protein